MAKDSYPSQTGALKVPTPEEAAALDARINKAIDGIQGLNFLLNENGRLKRENEALLNHLKGHCPDFDALYGEKA